MSVRDTLTAAAELLRGEGCPDLARRVEDARDEVWPIGREPRVVRVGELMPEVGSRWKIAGGALCGLTMTIVGRDEWTYDDGSLDSDFRAFSTVRHRFPLIEVLP